MPDQASNLPAFALVLRGETAEARKQVVQAVHPDYEANHEHWQVMLDAFEGAGGFADGAYLWPYRNELAEDYDKRQTMARYHNYVEPIIDLYTQHVFTQEPERQTDDPELQEWWADVDGDGTSMSAWMKPALAMALASGHTGALMDATQDAPIGPAKADQRSRPFLTRFPATAIKDWRTARDLVLAVKLQEAVPAGSIAEEVPEGDEAWRYLLWDEEGWARFTAEGEFIEGGVLDLGLVPFDVIRPKRSILKSFCGRSLFSNFKIVQALFNRHSEEDEVLRNQAFSLLTVEVPEDGDVEQARKQLGEEVGTTRALVVKGKSAYIAPDMAVPEQVRMNADQIKREMYRVAHMRYERDSLQAESAEAIRLQFKELNEFLQGIAAELQRFELRMARFYYAWTQPTPEAAERAFEAANVSVNYPDEFFLADLRLDLDAWMQAIAMNLGPTMTKRLKKKAVRRLEPELPPEEAETIDKEIDAQPDEQAMGLDGAANKLKQASQARMSELLSTTSRARAS